MTIDEAIKHCEEVAYQKDMESGFETDNERYAMTDKERTACKECAEEHRQLAEWLKDYKRLLEREAVLDKIRAEIEQIKSIMNEEIINNNRKDLINFVNGLNQSLVIVDKYKTESEDKE